MKAWRWGPKFAIPLPCPPPLPPLTDGLTIRPFARASARHLSRFGLACAFADVIPEEQMNNPSRAIVSTFAFVIVCLPTMHHGAAWTACVDIMPPSTSRKRPEPFSSLSRHAVAGRARRCEKSLAARWRRCFGHTMGFGERRVASADGSSKCRQSAWEFRGMHRKRGTQAVAGRFLCGSAACKFGPLVRLGGPAGFFRCIRTGGAFFESPCSTGPALAERSKVA